MFAEQDDRLLGSEAADSLDVGVSRSDQITVTEEGIIAYGGSGNDVFDH